MERKRKGLLTAVEFEKIQEKVDSFIVPDDIGRIPSKIASGFSGFTADQWRNWTVLYSLCSLKDILPHRDFQCWHLFVKACYLFCRQKITIQELDTADKLLMEFCETFQCIYGKDYCCINLHLHGHLHSCILDHGPVYAFWVFAFERMNGVIGSFHTNCHDISVQLMRRALEKDKYCIDHWPQEYREEFISLIAKSIYDKGSLMQASLTEILQSDQKILSEVIQPLPPVHEAVLDCHHKDAIKSVIRSLIDGFSTVCKM